MQLFSNSLATPPGSDDGSPTLQNTTTLNSSNASPRHLGLNEVSNEAPGIAAKIGTMLMERLSSFDRELESATQRIRQAADEAVKAAEAFIGKPEAAEFLNMSVTTLERRMAEKNGPPRYTDGGRVTFLRSELREWRKRWRVNP